MYMSVEEKYVNGRKCRFLTLEIEEQKLTLGYVDIFNKVHLYTSEK